MITPRVIGFVLTVTRDAFAPIATQERIAEAELSCPVLVDVRSMFADSPGSRNPFPLSSPEIVL